MFGDALFAFGRHVFLIFVQQFRRVARALSHKSSNCLDPAQRHRIEGPLSSDSSVPFRLPALLGRPKAFSDKQESRALERLAQGLTVAAARELNASRQTIMRLRYRSAEQAIR
jgi:hypothetical protein